MAYVKYTPEQIASRKAAQAAIVAAKASLKAMRTEKKHKGLYLAEIRRAGKAYLRRRKEVAKVERLQARMAKVAKKEAVSPEVALKKKCRPLLAVLRKVYKPYLVARRKVARLKKLKLKAELQADRKAAKEAAQAAKHQLELKAAEELIAKNAEKRTTESTVEPKKPETIEIIEEPPKKPETIEIIEEPPKKLETPKKLKNHPVSPSPLIKPTLRRSPRLVVA